MNRQSRLCSLVIAAFLCAAFPALAQETVRVAVSNFSASYISMYIASKRGYYAEEGIAVEIILMAGAHQHSSADRQQR
jgi:ABC-type nitrate/sulfonate/bicarbonate transport system substrate-binding protein